MDDKKLEHPPPAPWNISSDPEKSIVDPKDRPEDEWNNIAYQRSVRQSGRQLR